MFLYDCVYNTRLQTCCWSGRALCIQFEKCVCLFHSSGNSAYQLAPLPSSWTQECSNNTECTQPFTREYEFPGREFLIFVSPISYSDVWYHLLSHKPELRDSCCWTDSYCVDDVAASWPGLSFRRVFTL